MTIYFTADLHLGHANAIGHSNRPFDGLREMERAIIDRWNERVTGDDDVFVVGDFAYKVGGQVLWKLFHELKGRKHLVIGNHDNLEVQRLPWASPPEHRRHIVLYRQGIVLDHYAGRVWLRSGRGDIQLYGHSHGKLPGNDRQLDVGVDCWDFRPVTLPEIKARLATLPPYRSQEVDEPETDEGFKP